MAFGSIFVPDFMVQAVVRSEPGLGDRAVAVVDGMAPVWSVVGFSQAAAKAGIEMGMTKSQAQQFCETKIRHRSRAQEKAAHAALLDLGWSVSPRIEDTAPDTIVLDLAGLNSLWGPDEKIAAQLAECALKLGLITQVAVASKMDAAILAARGFLGITVIAEGQEEKIIGSLPVSVLAPPAEVLETLDRWGVRTCAALAALPVLQLSERLGQEGVRLQELARGQSERSMVLAEPAVYFEEEMELEDALEELEPLSFLLGRLLDQLCARLSARSLAACAVRVRFELEPSFEADFPRPFRGKNSKPASGVSRPTLNHSGLEEIHRPSGTPAVCSGLSRHSAPLRAGLPHTTIGAQTRRRTTAARRLSEQGLTSGQQAAPKIYERVLTLPVPMRDSKMLLKLVRLHLQLDAPTAPILKIFLAADASRPRVAQGELFRPSSPDPEKLELTVARLANLVGHSNVGSPELMDTHRPGEFRMRRFGAPEERHPRRCSADKKAAVVEEIAADSNQRVSAHPMALRLFRPALPARVELREGCPTSIGFPGRRGRVVAASGPWRSSGDWWREDGWQNDEWDLEIEFPVAHEKRESRALEAQVVSALERPASAAMEVRTEAGSSLQWKQPIANRSATNASASSLRGFYRVFYDAIRQEWFVRGAYD
jgi:nucleotidyltransferase/DNA polymerase involved in DNA repair